MNAARTLSMLLVLGVGLSGCPEEETTPTGPTHINPCQGGAPDESIIQVPAPEAGLDQTHVQGALVIAWPGSTVCLAEGTYSLDMELIVTMPGVTIAGMGQDKSILDFTNQDIGANGMLITGDQVTVEALAVKNTPGDGIRAQNVDDIVFRNVSVIWDADESEESGAYGLYPVGCDTVLIEGCIAKGARDAGIYVGQSRNIIVRDSEAYGNVAGIEIENSLDAEVYNNHAHDNTCGILVFNLPGLPMKGGERANVHDNLVENNNLNNFAPGGIVSNVPPGVGMLILACDENEFHHNTITGNVSTGIIIVHYIEALFGGYNDPEYNIYSSDNWIHDNVFEGNGQDPQGIMTVVAGPPPLGDVILDGCAEVDDRNNGNCLSSNGAGTFTDMDFCPEGAASAVIRTDIAAVTCEGITLPTTTLEIEEVAPVSAPEVTVGFDTLSEYGFFEGPLADQTPAANTYAYAPASPLFSDYTAKHRFFWLPEGTTVTVNADGSWDFPTGAIVIKTFAFANDLGDPASPQTLIETRLLVKEEAGWRSESYLWNDAQSEAERITGGKRMEVTYTNKAGDSVTTPYLVPHIGQCSSCHAQNDTMELLGVTTAQMNAPGQLAALAPALTQAPDPTTAPSLLDPFGDGPLEDRARAYLHANCSHCHQTGGAADNSGLHLRWDETDTKRLGICKQPAAAGAGGGGGTYDIQPGSPDASIMVQRMSSTNPAVKMPELPNLVIHAEGLDLIREWIAAMPAEDCTAP